MNACISASSAWTVCWRSCAAHALSTTRSATGPCSGCRPVRSRSAAVTPASTARFSARAAASSLTTSPGVRSGGWPGSKATRSPPARMARSRAPNTARSVSTRWFKQSAADHSPGAGGRVSSSPLAASTRLCQRAGVVERIRRAASRRSVMGSGYGARQGFEDGHAHALEVLDVAGHQRRPRLSFRRPRASPPLVTRRPPGPPRPAPAAAAGSAGPRPAPRTAPPSPGPASPAASR